MKFKIVDMKTGIVGGWCDNFRVANKVKKEFYNTDLKLYGECNGYIILLNEEAGNE